MISHTHMHTHTNMHIELIFSHLMMYSHHVIKLFGEYEIAYPKKVTRPHCINLLNSVCGQHTHSVSYMRYSSGGEVGGAGGS